MKEVFKKGSFLASSNLSLKFIKNDQKDPKISFVIPKSVVKSAVKRNFLKRRGYRTIKSKLNMLPDGFLGAFIFGKKSMEVFYGKKSGDFDPIFNLNKEIDEIIRKIN